MPESCSDLGAEGHPFAVVPKGALDEALVRVEELEAGLQATYQHRFGCPPYGENSKLHDEWQAVWKQACALLKDGER